MSGTGPSAVFNPAQRQINQGQPDWYSYVVSFSNLAAAANATQNIQIDASAQFFWTSLAFFCVQHGDGDYTLSSQIVPNATILITDGGSSKQLMSAPAILSTVASNQPGWPTQLQHPRLFDRNSAITVLMANQEPTIALDIYVTFNGFRVYGVN